MRVRGVPGLIAMLVFATLAAADDPPTDAGDAPSVKVRTIAARPGRLPAIVTAYGTIMPAPGAAITLSVQQEGRVVALDATPGQRVRAGQMLLRFAASAIARAQARQAETALALARSQRVHTAQLLAQSLATRDQLAQADKAVTDAQGNLDSLRRDGADRDQHDVTAPFDGVVASLPVGPGDRVAAGAPLVTLTRVNGLVASVGIDPAEYARVQAGQGVSLQPLDGGAPTAGTVIRVDPAIDPRTRLIDATLAPAAPMLAGQSVKATIDVGVDAGFVVPRAAVLADDRGPYLFQLVAGHAKRVEVREHGGDPEVVQGAIDPKLPVIVDGNYQLADGGAVREGDTTAP